MDRHVSCVSRRQFLVSTGTASAALLTGCGRWPGRAASPPAPVYRIGVLTSFITADDPLFLRRMDRFRQVLTGYGYVEGQNLRFDIAAGAYDSLPALAAGLTQLPVDLILANGPAASLAARQASSTLPIVFVQDSDPVSSGIVASLARPGGNATGLSTLTSQLGSKWVELLREVVPGLSRMAVLYADSPVAPDLLRDIEHGAQTLGVQLLSLPIGSPNPDIDGAMQAAAAGRAEALLIVGNPVIQTHSARLLAIAAQDRLPTMVNSREQVLAGALMTYGANIDAQYSRAAYYVDRILKGTKPADLPVEQPMTFDFVVNLKTARELGITFPQEILLQVTEVIQ